MKKVSIILITFVCGLLIMSMVIALTGCKNQVDDLEYIKNKGTLVVGVTDYEPMDYQPEGSTEWTGFDAEMAKLIAQELGVEIIFEEIDWEEKITELKSKKIDVIWNGMTVTDDLAKNMDFSYSYAKNSQVAVVKNTNLSTYSTTQAMINNNAKVVAESGSSGESTAISIFGESKVVGLGGQINALSEVMLGTSDVAFIDYTMAAAKCGKGEFTDLSIVPNLNFAEEEFAIGIRKNSNLTAKINELLVKYYKNGTMTQLKNQFGETQIALIDLSTK